jgi:hypothetical protein
MALVLDGLFIRDAIPLARNARELSINTYGSKAPESHPSPHFAVLRAIERGRG